ncbi:cytochrome c [Planctomicrobium sp.]|jgi:hypothetical protein|nr:hypothetical protein [Planctomicrobium sp.]MBT5018487.1 hypothetical protein [Planctomicrobium sp.]MDB4743475.1 cytochrome c [Planctomicrobium sp.]
MQRIDQPRILSAFYIGLSFSIIAFVGCGGGDEKPTEQAETTTTQQPAAVNSESTQVNTTEPAVVNTVDPNKKETKWIGTIPYDVFYDQPLTVAADATVIGGNAPVAVATSGGSPEMASNDTSNGPPAGSPPAAGGNGVDWATILPIDALQGELKVIRTRLTTNLQSVGNYNRSAEDIALDGAIVAGLGAIVTVHPEADTWKDRGKFIRDLGYEIYSSSGESGRTAFTATEEPFLKLQTAMDGGTVSGLEPEEVVPFGDVIYVSDMMQRLEFTVSNLKANVNTEARMKEDPERVMRDLHMLAAFGSLMGTESYDNADAEGYQALVATFVGGAMKGVDAVKAENYEGFREGLSDIQTTCSECHQQYRGSDSGF